jgi:hypothetical protein
MDIKAVAVYDSSSSLKRHIWNNIKKMTLLISNYNLKRKIATTLFGKWLDLFRIKELKIVLNKGQAYAL